MRDHKFVFVQDTYDIEPMYYVLRDEYCVTYKQVVQVIDNILTEFMRYNQFSLHFSPDLILDILIPPYL